MTAEQSPHPPSDPGESSETVQLLVADAGNRSAISGMLDAHFDVETSQTVTDADLYLIEDALFPECQAALRERIERERPAFCPIVLIRRENTDLRRESLDPSGPDGGVRYDEVIDAPLNPPQLIRRLNSLLVRRHQSRELMQQVSTLEQREQRLRRFEQGVESTGNGIAMTDPAGTIEYVNPALESMAGYTEDDVLGRSPQMLLPEETGGVFDEEFWPTMADQGEWEGDIIIERKDSNRIVVNATATALRDAEDETQGFVIVLSDITERIQRENDLEDREVELDLLRQILTRYLRHNLRNDLNVIQASAEMLKADETLSPEQIGKAQTIIDKTEALTEKSETARTYSSLLDREAELSAFDLSQLTTNAMQNVRGEFPDVAFEIDVPETCEIRAREGIQRAFEELIDNAARHNDAADPRVRIQVRDRDGARLVIEDNGPGIPDQERVALERGTETQLSHSQGVGLWLCKWMIEGVDSRLSFESIDPGTRVTADFPPTASVGSTGLEVTTLKERERRLQTITDRMTDGILEVDDDWILTLLDGRAEEILDVDADFVVGHRLWDAFSELRETQFETAVRNAMESRSSTRFEAFVPGIDVWLEVNVYPEFDEGLSFYIRDVTERIERGEALQETEHRLKTIIELSPEPILAVDSSGTVFLWNTAAEEVFGYSAADVIGERVDSLDLFGDGQSARFTEYFERVLAGETIRGLEAKRQRKDGTTVDLSISATPIHDVSGTETGVLAVTQDISALKERERNLAERVKELSAVHAATDLFQSADTPVEVLLTEFVETLPQSFRFPDITTARLRYDDFEVSTTAFDSGDQVLTAHADLEDGSEIRLEVGYMSDPRIEDEHPFLAEEAELLDTLVTVVKNHVQRRTHLRALERTERLLTNAERLGDVGVWEVDIEPPEVFCSDGARRILGMSAEVELTPEQAMEFFHPEDRETVTDTFQTCAESGGSFTLEARIQTRNGDERWVHIEGEPLETDDGKSTVRGYIQDITDRKERKTQLQRYEYAFRSSLSGIAIASLDGELIDVNPVVLDMWGFDDKNDVLGRQVGEFWEDPEKSATVMDAIKEQGSWEGEREGVRADGSTFYTRSSASLMRNDEGESIGVMASFVDITERKERNRRYEAIFNQTFQFTGLLEPDGAILEANDTALDFAGIARADVVGEKFWNAPWFEISEETQQQTKADVQRAAAGEFVRRDLEVKGADGTVVIDFSIRPITDDDGTVILLVPEGRDISDLKQHERELERTNAFLSTLFETIPAGVTVFDSNGNITKTNSYAEEQLGLVETEIPDRTYRDPEWQIYGDNGVSLDPEALPFAKVMETGEVIVDYRYEITLSDGSERWLSANAAPLRGEDGGIEKVVAVIKDITDLRDYQQRFEANATDTGE